MNAPLPVLAATVSPLHAPISFTIFWRDDLSPVGKRYRLVEGKAVKSQVSLAVSHGNLVTLEKASDLKVLIASLRGNSFLCAGVPITGAHEFKVSTKAQMRDGFLSRSDDQFMLSNMPGFGLVDLDVTEKTPDHLRTSFEGIFHAVESVTGIDFADIAWVQYSSSSSFIQIGDDTTTNKGLRGHHTLIMLTDASDWPRALDAIAKRLIIGGMGYIHICSNGSQLIHTIVDMVVAKSPSRAIFSGKADLGKGLQYVGREVYSNNKQLLDTRARIPDLTTDELQRYEAVVAELMAASANEAVAMRAAYDAARLDSMLAAGTPPRQARDAIEGMAVGRLESPCEITLASGKTVTVRDILVDLLKYDGEGCLDPADPGYDSGRVVAKIYTKDGSPKICSFAHGGAGNGKPSVYLLVPSIIDDFDDITSPTLPQVAPAGPTQPSTTSASLSMRLMSADDLAGLPKMSWRIKGVLPERGLAALYGPSGAGKSFLVLDMLAAVAAGGRWHGYLCKPAPVVYVALEGEAGLAQRVAAYRQYHGGNLTNVHFLTAGFGLLSPGAVTDLAHLILNAGGAGAVVCIDTLNQATPGADENTSADMGKAIAACKALQHLVSGLVLLVHHTGKTEGRGLRGHSSLLAALDAAVEITRDGDCRAWGLEKSKDGADGAAHGFKLQVVQLGIDEDCDPMTSCVVVPTGRVSAAVKPMPAPMRAALNALVELCGGDGATGQTTVDEWRVAVYAISTADSSEGKKTAFRRAKEKLVGAGLVAIANEACWPAAH